MPVVSMICNWLKQLEQQVIYLPPIIKAKLIIFSVERKPWVFTLLLYESLTASSPSFAVWRKVSWITGMPFPVIVFPVCCDVLTDDKLFQVSCQCCANVLGFFSLNIIFNLVFVAAQCCCHYCFSF